MSWSVWWSIVMLRDELSSRPKPKEKPFAISKRVVWEYLFTGSGGGWGGVSTTWLAL